jgi:hypothetical protein
LFVYVCSRTDAGRTQRAPWLHDKETTMHDPTVATAWQRFLDKVKGFRRTPVKGDVADTTRAVPEREKEATAESPAVSQR